MRAVRSETRDAGPERRESGGDIATDASHLASRIAPLDVAAVRRDFPILQSTVRGKPLVYLDSAATGQKPRVVIDAIEQFYAAENANIHRGVHFLSEQATVEYDAARVTAQRFLNARHAHEVIFTRGTTEGINLVAASFGRAFVRAGDEIIVTGMEHHSNIVPWQLLCEQTGAVLRVVPITDAGELDLEAFERLLGPRTRLVAVVHLSNALGTINPIERMIARAHAAGVPVLVDGAQSAPHLGVDVQALDCDFFVFSGHKAFGPTGIGVLYGRESLLDRMPPYQGGGDMIATVSFERTTYAPLPSKFEAGTPHIAGAVGLAAALRYVQGLGLDRVRRHEDDILAYATAQFQALPGVTIVGTAPAKASVLSFTMTGVHPHDIGTILDAEGIAIRAGHHCAQPLMDRLGLPATARASIAPYTTRDEIDALVGALHTVRRVFGA
jgi:cysteine desulfurase / selenocysteine lyase